MNVLFNFERNCVYIFHTGLSHIRTSFSLDDIFYISDNVDRETTRRFSTIVKVDMGIHPIIYYLSTLLKSGDINFAQISFRNSLDYTDIIKSFAKIAHEAIDNDFPKPAENDRKLIDKLRAELKDIQTLVKYIPLNNNKLAYLELHVSEFADRTEDIMHLVPANQVNATKVFGDGVQIEEHGGVGYHFHYCVRIDERSFDRTKFLLSYNSKDNGHLGDSPTLYWEVHSENRKNKRELPQKFVHKWAIYHRCNGSRLDILRREPDAIFRNKGKDAQVYFPIG